jgi:glycosyltransferase involved in cell wall biosynthesis
VTRPLRILLVSPRYPPAVGGVERVVEMLATGLAQGPFDVVVATTDPSRTLPSLETRGGLVIRRFSTIGHDAVFFLSPRLALWVLRNAGQFDVIHAHSYHTPLALVGAIAARLRRVPFVISTHYHGTGHTAGRRLLHRPYRLFGAWMIRQASLVICCSEAERTLIREHFGARLPTMVVQYGVDAKPLPPAEPRPAADGRTVLTGGRLEGYKQVDLAVRAVEYLPRNIRLIVFGDGPALPEIRSIARKGHLDERIDFVGRVSDEDLGGLFRSASAFVSLSRNEAYGLTVAEALAAGTGVVCSDIPAYRELLDKSPNGAIRLVDVDAAPADVASAILAAADAPRPIVGEGPPGPTWDDMVAETVEGYRGVLEARRD